MDELIIGGKARTFVICPMCGIYTFNATMVLSDKQIRSVVSTVATQQISPKVTFLLFVLPSGQHLSLSLQDTFQIFVDGKCHGLAGRDAHNTRRDAFVETTASFLFPHVANHSQFSIEHLSVHTYLEIARIRPIAVCPGSAGVFCSLVLMVSMGALLNGPIAPDTRPMNIVS